MTAADASQDLGRGTEVRGRPAHSAAWLFVPGSRPDRFDNAAGSGADELILDLEDSVAPSHKGVARESVTHWLQGGIGWVRVNSASSRWFEDDLAALASAPGLRGVVLPKADDIGALSHTHETLGGPWVVPLIETCRGLDRIRELARSEGVLRLAFGSVDFALDVGAADDGASLLFARSELVFASRLAGLAAPLDGVTTALRDAGETFEAASRARSLGFGGKLCIHPAQIPPVRQAFRPGPEELAWARQVIRVAEEAGDHAASWEGHMIDRPVVERARWILET